MKYCARVATVGGLRVLHVSTYDAGGGAARAARALHDAMVRQGIDSTLLTAVPSGVDPTIIGLPGRSGRIRFLASRELEHRLWHVQSTGVRTWRSPAYFGALRARTIDAWGADVVNLHWVTDGLLTVPQIGRILTPTAWSLYDMWAFCGSEHYGVDTPDARWRSGYTRANRPGNARGVDLDRLCWTRKTKRWTRPMSLVAASSWMADRVRSSRLMGSWPLDTVPHPIDCRVFTPQQRSVARRRLGIDDAGPVVLFLSSAGIGDTRKGWDLLDRALERVRRVHPGIRALIVGPKDAGPPESDEVRGDQANRIWAGTVSNDADLAWHYAAADVVAVPSREDNMPLTAMEAQACGRSVVGFRIGGVPDIVEHGRTGILAATIDSESLADALEAALDDALSSDAMGLAARERAVARWSDEPVVSGYVRVYEQARRQQPSSRGPVSQAPQR